jgi:hypothetical protein
MHGKHTLRSFASHPKFGKIIGKSDPERGWWQANIKEKENWPAGLGSTGNVVYEAPTG